MVQTTELAVGPQLQNATDQMTLAAAWAVTTQAGAERGKRRPLLFG